MLSIETSRSRMELFGDFRRVGYPNEVSPGVYDIHSPRVPTTDEIVDLLHRAAQDTLISARKRSKSRAVADAKHVELARDVDADPRDVAGELADALDDVVGDDLLQLVFTACHPVLPTEARVALTLRLVGVLASSEIARAFLVPEPTTPVAVTSVLGGLHVDYRRAA